MSMTLREKILSNRTLRSETVTVPEWGGDEVVVRAMTGRERDAYEHDMYQQRENGIDPVANMRARLLVHCLYTPDGQRQHDVREGRRRGDGPNDRRPLHESNGRQVRRAR